MSFDPLPHEPVKLYCYYCGDIIYQDEEYELEDEYRPTSHNKCDTKYSIEEKEKHDIYIKELRNKDKKSLTWEETIVVISEDCSEALRESMFKNVYDYFGTKDK